MKRLVPFALVPLLVLCLLLSPLLFVLPALAASSGALVVPSGAVVQSAFLLWMNSTAGLVGMAMALWLFQQWLRAYVKGKGLEADERVRSYVLPLLDVAVNAAFARLGPIGLLASVGPAATPEALAIRAEHELDVVRYVESKAKGGLEHFGLSGPSVREMASERLDALAGELMKSAPAPLAG